MILALIRWRKEDEFSHSQLSYVQDSDLQELSNELWEAELPHLRTTYQKLFSLRGLKLSKVEAWHPLIYFVLPLTKKVCCLCKSLKFCSYKYIKRLVQND